LQEGETPEARPNPSDSIGIHLAPYGMQPPRKINAILARLLHIHSWAIFPVVAVPFNDSITEIADPTSRPAFVPDCVPHKAPEAQCLDLTLFPHIDLIL